MVTSKKRKMLAILTSIFTVLFFTLSIVSPISKIKAEDKQPVGTISRWLICSPFSLGGLTETLVTYAPSYTDALAFAIHSKPFSGATISEHNNFYNRILKIGSTKSFADVNSPIIGYNPESQETVNADAKPDSGGYNQGETVTPYQRFGLAGLNFTMYLGEWHYTEVHICANTVDDSGKNNYYEGRQQPLDSYRYTHTSKDPRSAQVGNIGGQIGATMLSIIIEFIFGILKALFAITMALVRLAFSDIVGQTGIGEIAYGENSAGSGMIGNLFTSVYTPLIVLVMVISALQVFYVGVIKRGYRESLSIIITSVFAFILSMVIFVKPALVVSVPNNAAVIGQSIMVSAMSGGVDKGGQICSGGTKGDKDGDQVVTDEEKSTVNEDNVSTLLETVGERITDSIGCPLWETVLFRPWSYGQFGTSWENLYVKGHAPSQYNNTVNNSDDNANIVGDGEVPLGGGAKMNNWALYQLSTQTDVHASSAKDGSRPTIGSGYNDDIFRVVDALANVYYEEKEVANPLGDPYKYMAIRQEPQDKIYEEWGVWVGNSQGYRLGLVFEALVTGVIVMILPLIFAGIAAMLGVIIVLLACFAPIFLLFGSMGTKGFDILKGYGELILNTTLARIFVGFVLVLAIVLSGVALEWMRETSYVAGLAMLVMSLFGMKFLWHKVKEIFASFSFSQSGSQFKQASEKFSNGMKKTAGLASTFATGAVQGKRHGLTMRESFMSVGKKVAVNKMYTNEDSRYAAQIYEAHKARARGQRDLNMSYCVSCGEPMSNSAGRISGRGADGSYYCADCYNDLYNTSAMADVVELDSSYWTKNGTASKSHYDSTTKTNMFDTAHNARSYLLQEFRRPDSTNLDATTQKVVEKMAQNLASEAIKSAVDSNHIPQYVIDAEHINSNIKKTWIKSAEHKNFDNVINPLAETISKEIWLGAKREGRESELNMNEVQIKEMVETNLRKEMSGLDIAN